MRLTFLLLFVVLAFAALPVASADYFYHTQYVAGGADFLLTPQNALGSPAVRSPWGPALHGQFSMVRLVVLDASEGPAVFRIAYTHDSGFLGGLPVGAASGYEYCGDSGFTPIPPEAEHISVVVGSTAESLAACGAAAMTTSGEIFAQFR